MSPAPRQNRLRTSTYAIVWRVTAALLLIVVVLGSIVLGHAPRWLGLYVFAAGIVSAGAYWWDKQRAIAGEWRISESTLHMLDLLGGVIGGLMAQVAWRHKTAKPDFGMVTALVVLVDLFALAALVIGFVDLPVDLPFR